MKSKLFILPSILLIGNSAVVFSTYNSKDSSNAINHVITLCAGKLEAGGKTNYAYFSDGNSVKSISVHTGTKFGDLKAIMPTPILSGYDVSEWHYFDDDETEKKLEDNVVIEKNYVITAQWNEGSPAKSFATDSWSTIFNIIDKASAEGENPLNVLKETYKNDISLFNNTFVIQDISNPFEVSKKTRVVSIPNVGDFRVRVIGEDHDELTSGGKATLTFEFVDLAAPNVAFSSTGNKTYASSDLKTFINKMFYASLPSNLQEGIKEVKKYTNGAYSNEKMFVISGSEMGLENSSLEGTPYNFYSQNYVKKSRDPNTLIKTYTNPKGDVDTLTYWTRSSSTNGIYVIGEDGISKESETTIVHAVSPCFAI